MIELGDTVKCEKTDFEGIASAIAVYINGCRRISVQPRIDKKGKWREGYWMDETTVVVLKKGTVKPEKIKKQAANLGDVVECKVTGFTGYVDNISEYLSGMRYYGVQPKIDAKGNLPDSKLVQEAFIVLKEKEIIKSKQQTKGGPRELSREPV